MAQSARRVSIGLVQINNSFSGQSYLPYSVGCLEGYVRRHSAKPEDYEFLLPVYKRMPVRDAVSGLLGCDVAGFSIYVWNARISLEIARRLKAAQPNTLIIFGGPHVPDQTEPFLRENPFIDIAVNGEGEKTFLALLEALPARPWQDIPGVSFISADGKFIQTLKPPRIKNLDEVPSPFLDGVFDPLMAANPDETWIGLWETNRGCPFQCTYCDWGSATAAKVTKFEMDRLLREAEWFSQNRIEFIFCCDANFGMLSRDATLAEYVGKLKQESGYPKALSVQNTKNATEKAYRTQKILSDAGLNKGVALSMQTLSGDVLKNIKRDNISLETYLELQRRFARDGVETFSDLIIGLPGETYDSFMDGIDLLINSGQHNRVQFNDLSILPNAEMANPEYIREHGLELVESEIINIHGSRVELDDDVPEIQQLVVATGSMPREDWRRVRAAAWMTAFLHFDKLFQIPLILIHETTGIRYRTMIETFMGVDARNYPLLADIRDFFLSEAASIQRGGAEYTYSEEWLGIYWPADEYKFIDLTVRNQFGRFYQESCALMKQLAAQQGADLPADALENAVQLNHALLKQPFITDDATLTLSADVLTFWTDARQGAAPRLIRKPLTVQVSRAKAHYASLSDWCREVVWWGNKKGAYLYTNQIVEMQLAGHF
ncbi:radical SAM protein [Ferrovibrio terrae]|uniref:B12-binding domain-containing radical SAM protein n=1 Tax=Ferrovibrio terrae TaxID=2594003 RepID=UPI0031381A87